MASSNSKATTDLQPDLWQNQSADERLKAVNQLADNPDNQERLLQIANSDEYKEVRLSAVQLISNLKALAKLRKETGDISDAASLQYSRLLAASIKSELSVEQRTAEIASLSPQDCQQVALLAKCKSAGSEALARIVDNEDLADLVLFAASVHVRKNAAEKIDNIKILKSLAKKVKDKDKTVSKVLESKLSSPPASAPEAEITSDETAVKNTQPIQESIAKVTAPSKPDDKNHRADQSSEPKENITTKPEAVAAKDDPATLLAELEQEFSKLSHKNTLLLNKLRKSFKQSRKAIQAESSAFTERAENLDKQITELEEKNSAHQKNLGESTSALLNNLKEALDNGKSHDALPTWDKIQGNISNTSGALKAELQAKTNEYKAKLDELRDWKIFASTEKKKELITQIQNLIDSKMHAADKSRHIGTMHKEWKALGRSNQNEELWREFKQLSDKAYEPCKEHFKQRKQLMSTNLKQRKEICNDLEKRLAAHLDESEVIDNISKFLNEIEKHWKEYAPIEQSKIKSLQKRYYASVNQLRKIRKSSLRGNSRQKQELVKQAETLAISEDNRHAMNEAKKLQQQWKDIGSTSYKDDKKFWEDFRSACDKIFAKRNQQATQSTQAREQGKQIENDLGKVLNSLEKLLSLDEDNFRQSRHQYQELVQEFSATMDPSIKRQRKQLLDQFNGVKRKIDHRFEDLPDKKHLLLKDAVLSKSKHLQELESKLLDSKDDEQLGQVKSKFDEDSWSSIDSIGNQQYEKALNERLRKLHAVRSVSELHKLAADSEIEARSLCVDLEIKANIDTPAEDQALRMKIQLDQLKDGFGQSKPDRKETAKYALDSELLSYCIGPLSQDAQQQLSTRMEGAIKKLR